MPVWKSPGKVSGVFLGSNTGAKGGNAKMLCTTTSSLSKYHIRLASNRGGQC